MKVHSLVGPGLREEIYHQELARALTAAGIPHLCKPRRDLVYRGFIADTFEPDFVVLDHFIPELKTLRGKFVPAHLVQLFCYCKFWRLRTSLLVDFGKQSLQWKRLLYRSRACQLPDVDLPAFVSSPELASDITTAVRDCLHEIGLGYRETTWKGLVAAAIQAANLRLRNKPTVTVRCHSDIALSSLIVEGACAVLVTALTQGITASDRAILQTHLRWLDLDWGIIFHFGKRNADLCFVQAPSNNGKFHPSDPRSPTDWIRD